MTWARGSFYQLQWLVWLPVALGESCIAFTMRAPLLWPKTVTCCGSPPKLWINLFTQRRDSSWSFKPMFPKNVIDSFDYIKIRYDVGKLKIVMIAIKLLNWKKIISATSLYPIAVNLPLVLTNYKFTPLPPVENWLKSYK